MPKILLIDDDRLVCEATTILLRAKGYEVRAFQDGKSGIEAVKADHFDLAIVDLFMPDMDGLQVMQAIRRANSTIPMIAASGFMFAGEPCPPMPGFDGMASDVGATQTLYKPFRPSEVLRAVERALGAAA